MNHAQSTREIDLPDLGATHNLGTKLAQAITPGLVVYLFGELGAGKTTLVREILNAMGYEGAIKSPTYTLVETYEVHNLILHHFDLYRLADPSELEFIGIRDYANGWAICMFEWPQKGMGYIPQPDLEIELQLHAHGRRARMHARTPKAQAVLASL